MIAPPVFADAPEKSMSPAIRPVLGEKPAWTLRPTLRPKELAAMVADLGENSPVPKASDEDAEIGAALLAADAMRAVGAVDNTLVVAERNIDPEALDIDPAPETTRLATVEPSPVPAIETPAVPEVEADTGVTLEPEEELEVVSRLAPSTVSIWPGKRPNFVVRPKPDPVPTPEVEVASTAVITPTIKPSVTPPPKRPKGLLALFRAPDKPAAYPKEGSVCGDPAIRGQVVPPVTARITACGIANPVKITAVDGVQLSTPATINCGTAQALRAWVTNTVKPVVGGAGGGVSSLRVAASYSCRTRNNIPGAKISEHGKGNAIDISAVTLKDGTTMTLLQGWRHGTFGPMLKAMHKGACGTFGTVLGPNSDRHHQDHFHFDIAKHGYGPYCR